MFYLILNNSLISHREAMYRVYSLQLGPNFGVQPVAYQKFYLQLKVDQMYAFAVFIEKICDHTAAVAPVIQLRSAVQFRILKYKVKSLK